MVPGIMGALCAVEALKVILGMNSGVLSRKLLLFNAKYGTFRTMRIKGRQVGCASCDPTAPGYIKDVKTYDYRAFTG